MYDFQPVLFEPSTERRDTGMYAHLQSRLSATDSLLLPLHLRPGLPTDVTAVSLNGFSLDSPWCSQVSHLLLC